MTGQAVDEGIANFHRRHKALYGFSDDNYPIEFFGFGLKAIGNLPRLQRKGIEPGGEDASAASKGERDAYFEESAGFVRTRVFDGDKLLHGNMLEGPCIVEERMTNVVIPPGFKMVVDRIGNYITAG